MTDETKTLTEDEQFAAITANNPLFDGNAPTGAGEPEAKETAAGGQQQTGADETAHGEQAKADTGVAGAEAGAGDQQAAAAAASGAEAGDADPNAQADEPFPGYSSLSEEARAAFDKIASDKAKAENDYRALHGMTAPLQRGNAELRRQHDALVARIQQLEQVGRKQQDVSAAKDQVTQEFTEWAKQFPEESKAISALVNPLREKVVALEGSLDAARAELGNLHVERQQAALAREVGELDKAHPEWRTIHESQDYWDWLGHQSPGIQSLNSSMFAGDTIQLLNLFKSSRPHAKQQTTPTQHTDTSGAADAVQQRRSQALERGTQPIVRTTESSARAGNQGSDMSDEDAQFASLVANNPNFS